MRVKSGYDANLVEEICKGCASNNVKKSYAFLRVANYHSGDKFICEIIDDCCFFAGIVCKSHFRLIEIAVKEEAQQKGYGTALLLRMKKLCREKDLTKITFRTAKDETAVKFFKKKGGVIVGEKGNDYEMEMKV